MVYYNTLGHNLKRGIFNFCKIISKGLSKPTQKFVADMMYGLLAAQSSHLTKIARKLNEKIALDKVVERLSRNLMNFKDAEKLTESYLKEVKKSFDDTTILIVDDGDIAKKCSKKLEGLCKVRDGSTGEITDGYWTAGVTALTAKHKQPIPVYNRVYSSLEKEHISNNNETIKSFEFMSAHFPKTTVRTLDRGYDAGYVFDYFIPREETFIVRMDGDRNVIHKGKKVLLKPLAKRF